MGLAAFSLAPPPPPNPPPARLAISEIWPNPAQSVAVLRLALPSLGPASLDVFDIQGRRMATVFHDEAHAAGTEEVSVRTVGWPAGLYLCRLAAGGATATRKLLVTR